MQKVLARLSRPSRHFTLFVERKNKGEKRADMMLKFKSLKQYA
jgi:hypothetical protein